ncbi:hypothetical protein CAMSH0001_1718 [Campylobacter showae RM3277]|uniref:Uncharacterized protein n=1 Tax=Campylobacter showae RM3277 TaxID=553219 RepID=C6REY3_9BACT|nr:hypothetical protein CAMSH0001_1718 [Campylobacter showae RM3277]
MSKFDAVKFDRHEPHLYGANSSHAPLRGKFNQNRRPKHRLKSVK